MSKKSYAGGDKKEVTQRVLSFDLYVFQKGSMKKSAIGGPKTQEQVAKIIESYVSQFMSNPENKVIEKEIGEIRFVTCMKLYNSQEYEQEIERIVKKYCEDCE